MNSPKIKENYHILGLIGKGGMGDVYKAEHKVLGRIVAIKSLKKELCDNVQFKERFKNEALVMAKLQHPGIVALYEYIEDVDGIYLVMEFAEGMALDDFIAMKDGKVLEDEAVEIMCKVLEAMQYAHDQGIIHRDIKPANIIYNLDKKSIKILDFGIAKLAQEAHRQLTKTGTQMGTVYYMSPEQVKGEQLDHRSDIYSLGVVFYQLLSGVQPYTNLSSEYTIYDKIVKEELELPKQLKISGKSFYSVRISLGKLKNDRFKSCNDFIEELKRKEINTKENTKINKNNKKKSFNFLWVFAGIIIIYIGFMVTGSLNTEDDNTPEKVAKKYLTQLAQGNYDEAGQLGTEDTRQMLNFLKSLSGGQKPEKTNEVKNIKCNIAKDGKTAECSYCCNEEGGDDKIDLKLEDGKWLVDMKKENPMEGQEEDW